MLCFTSSKTFSILFLSENRGKIVKFWLLSRETCIISYLWRMWNVNKRFVLNCCHSVQAENSLWWKISLLQHLSLDLTKKSELFNPIYEHIFTHIIGEKVLQIWMHNFLLQQICFIEEDYEGSFFKPLVMAYIVVEHFCFNQTILWKWKEFLVSNKKVKIYMFIGLLQLLVVLRYCH